MIQQLKITDPFRSEWIERVLFANGEAAFAERLITLAVIGKIIGYNESIDDIVRISRHYAGKIDNQISVIDMSEGDPGRGRFISVGSYRMRGDAEDFSFIADIPNPVQRKQVMEDYYMARTLGVPLFAKVRAQMNGIRWSYDRILVPVRTRDSSVLISAFWHHDELAAKKF